MNGSGSSSRCACPTTSSTGSSGGSVRSSQVFASSRESTCTSRSRSSASGRPASSNRSSARCATLPQGRPGDPSHAEPLSRDAERRHARPRGRRRAGGSARRGRPGEAGAISASTVAKAGPGCRTSRSRAAWRGAVGRGSGSEPAAPARLEPPLGTFVPSDAAAYLSRLHPGGARYEVLESVALGG